MAHPSGATHKHEPAWWERAKRAEGGAAPTKEPDGPGKMTADEWREMAEASPMNNPAQRPKQQGLGD